MPVEPLPAATLLLLRDGADGCEVVMLERHRDAFFPGALVFPGGRVDEADCERVMLARCRKVAGIGAAAMAFRMAAIRETYEEAGILLARRRGEDRLIAAAELRELERRIGKCLGRALHFADLVASREIELATDCLVAFAHWVTPERSAKRYDTLFFLARAPDDQVPRPDGREAIDAVWIAPEAALADADAKRRRLIFATRMNLMRLQRGGDVAAALAATHAIVRICPEMYETPEGTRIRIPEGLGYDVFDMPTPDTRHG
ncbi:MAG TPA: NUDIX domain-containing protein [Stellaceae bacterium]|nr:NUDIX domain-containing protein [Stellaceae bacterium]